MRMYCIRSCIPIYHGSSDERLDAHCHTIEIVAYIEAQSGQFMWFSHVEGALNRYLERYHSQFLNLFPEFHGDTSIEGIGETFFAGITEALRQDDMLLKRIEVGETPLRRYVVGVME